MKNHRPDCKDAYPQDTADLLPHLPDASRRRLLKLLGATGAMGAAGSLLAPLTAMAQTAPATNDYKALVCLFMYGGNDSNNLVVPYDNAEYGVYQRGRSNLALRQDTLLPIAPSNTGGKLYGLHPAMAGLQTLFTAGKMGLVANVGPLMVPTTKAQWSARSVPLPMGLFSHSDQQDAWQSAIYDTAGRNGWGGRLMERLVPSNAANRGYSCISLAGGNLWESGDTSLVAYKVSSSGTLGFEFFDPTGTDPLSTAITQTLADQRPHMFQKAWLDTMGRSIEVQKVLSSALKGSTLATTFPNTGLGRQLGTAARLISARQSLGLSRQVFFVSIGGFDTHGDDQLQRQQQLFTEINNAVSAFYQSTVDMGVANNVTLFSASDFSRTFASNGQGSDHGWGGNQFVVGGAVRGGQLHGRFPDLTLGGPDDTGTGRWIPGVATDQMAATLGRWFGADEATLAAVLPRLSNFTPDVGFMA
jgi:uncharacterized protein (DUF1501 family)